MGGSSNSRFARDAEEDNFPAMDTTCHNSALTEMAKQSVFPERSTFTMSRVQIALNCHPFDGMVANGVDIPAYVKKNDATLTFPEKLMLLLIHVEKSSATSGAAAKKESIGWTMEGKAFVIRDKQEFLRTWLPLFFRSAKFPSFSRKLYRWGFRQLRMKQGFDSKSDRELYFFNPDFQKEKKDLMCNMSSVTAETKRQEKKREASGDVEAVNAAPLTLAQYHEAFRKESDPSSSIRHSSELTHQHSPLLNLLSHPVSPLVPTVSGLSCIEPLSLPLALGSLAVPAHVRALQPRPLTAVDFVLKYRQSVQTGSLLGLSQQVPGSLLLSPPGRGSSSL